MQICRRLLTAGNLGWIIVGEAALLIDQLRAIIPCKIELLHLNGGK
jgi:hypothetical protein